jgi:hypothetical protein
MSKEQVSALHKDPEQYVKIIFPEYDHMGFDYLEHANYGTVANPKWCYHPGKDLNGPGVGNADLGDRIYSASDGEVVYCYDGKDKNGGWGKLLVIREIAEEKKEEPKQEEPVQVPITVSEKETEAQPVAMDGYVKPNGQTVGDEAEGIIEKFTKWLIKLIFKNV